ncbi:hypothetical protein [Niabella ginsengisoli]|uniref:Uncharacterized protein n=1 Tax=Niabella ginsengisoli TaxID=522298 RepID=A0ABS9SFI2_9BACT|nr:hypothetical protein [Niabella ginsengisoli]MCH5597118.1 hypothetical protein [Niabella ginsengisoli]
MFIINSLGDILYWKKYSSELPIINSFKKGEKIFMGDTMLKPSPLDGLIIKFKHYKEALLYDSKLKTFENYRQYTQEEIDEMNNPEPEVSEEGDPEDTVATVN